MHLCTENIRSRIRSPRSLPSKIHAATPPQNLAAVESLLRAKRAARSSFSWPHGLLSERNRGDQHAFYLAAVFAIGTKWLGALFTYVRHSVLPRHSYDLASYASADVGARPSAPWDTHGCLSPPPTGRALPRPPSAMAGALGNVHAGHSSSAALSCQCARTAM